MRRLFNQLKTFGFKELYRRRKKRLTNSITKRFGDHLLKFYPKLPQNYKFVLLNYSVSGHFALMNFFKMCGLNYVRLAEDNYMDYGETKSFLLNSKGDNIVGVCLYNNIRELEYSKFFSYEAPVVITVRDPISRLKTTINHGYPKAKASKFEFSLKDDIDKSLPEIVYSGALTPQITDLEKIFDKKFIDFKYQSNLTPFLTNEGGGNPTQIIYIDTQDLQANKAFDTMQKLSKILHFNPPKEEDKAKFERKAWNDYALFLPFTLFINHKDFSYLKDKIKIIITEEPLNQLKDIKNLFLNENDLCYKHLSINVEQKHYELIKEDKEIKERLKSYFKEFIKVLDEKIRFRKENAIKEQDVLDYFKANKTLALKFKNILDKELTHIKQTRPDIIQSWNYYKEFE
ncbi:DUF2972 domain-containing protein, partial [Campylobacter helveticus]|uniref:DUF2972 domain-containing protein n=2 Tax=Campylobacter helveticus TaxID=28898 RepID=UPI001115CDE3